MASSFQLTTGRPGPGRRSLGPRVGDLVGDGLTVARLERVEDPGQAQSPEQRSEHGCLVHPDEPKGSVAERCGVTL